MHQYEPVKRTLGLVFFSLIFNTASFLAGENSITDDLEFTGTITFEHVNDAGGTFASDNSKFYTSEAREHILVVDGERFGTRAADNRAYSFTEEDLENQDDFETKLRLSFSESETFDVSSTNSIYVFNNGSAAVFSFVSNSGQMADLVSIPAQSGMTINLSDNNTAISYIDITTNNNFSIYISSLAVENVTMSTAPSLDLGATAVTFSQGADPIQVSPTGTVSLSDETMWNGGSLSAQISTNANPGDSLRISDEDEDDLFISVTNMDLLANDVVIGSLNKTDGKVGGDDLLSIDFNENATNATLQEVLQSLRFEEAYGFIQEELREITVDARNNDGGEIQGFKQVQLSDYPAFEGCAFSQAECASFSPIRPTSDNIVAIDGATELDFAKLIDGFPTEISYLKVQKINGELLINGQAVVKDQNDIIRATDVATFTPNRGDGQYNIIYGTLSLLIEPDTYYEYPTPIRVIGNVSPQTLSPTFTHAGNQTINQTAGATTVLNFITSFDDGNPYENDMVQFSITENDNPDLFSSAPEISNSGILTFTPNSNNYGIANLTIRLYNADSEESTEDNVTIYITPNGLLINEIYPKANSDFEFVEIINNGGEAQDLSDLVLVLFNGSNDLAYKDIGLEGSLNGNDFFVIGGDQVPNLDLDWGSTSFQNGPDAVALYVGSTSDFNTGSAPSLDGLVDVIVYGDSDDEDLRAAFGNASLREPGDDSNSLSRTVDDSNLFVIQPGTPGEANIDLGITLSITGLTGIDKVYNGTTLTEAAGTAELLGIEDGDDVYLAGTPEFNFITPDVATDIEISVTGYILEGADIDKYNLSLPTLTGNITVKALTITGLVGDNKVYDGNLEATVSGTAELSGVETNDEVILGGDPVYTFSSLNAAENIAITSSGYTIAGADAGNYSVTQPSGLTADITPKVLSIIVEANDKFYDGDVSASVSLASLNTDEEVIGDDDVSIGETPSAYAFEDSNTGSGKAVTIVEGEFTLSGEDASNYTVDQPDNLNADIIPKGLTLTITVNDKVYDGGLSATVDQTTLEGLVEGDLVTVSGPTTIDFQDVSVGTDKPIITEELFSIEGDAATNYFLDDSQSAGNILPKELSITGLVGNDKTYDGNTIATASGVTTLLGVIEADEVVLGGSPSFTFMGTSVAKDITIISSGYSISGTESGNYIITQPTLSADITVKALTVTGITGDDKVYDGTTTASATGAATLSGLESGDEVTLSGSPVFVFTSRNASSDVSIDVSGYALSGISAGNYTLTQPVLVADITPKALSVEVIANNKTYDKTTTATVGSVSLVGIENGDAVDIENSPSAFDFASNDVETDIAISATGNYTITGTDAGNYSVTQPSGLTADITPKVLSIIVEANNKIYDGDVSASVSSASLNTDEEVIVGDDVSIGETPSAYAFEDSNAGSGKAVTIVEGEFELSGEDASNYTVDQPDNLNADIIPKGLILTVTVNDKVYDGGLSATVDQTTLVGLVEGDFVTVSGPTTIDFQDARVGMDKPIITEEFFSIEGDAAANYFLDDSQSVGDILSKELSITGLVGNDKAYDGNTNATASGVATLLGVIEADEVVLGGNPSFTFTSTSVAKDITIISSGYSISGTESGNYTITQPTLSADVTAKALTVNGITGDDKVYDGTTAASATGTATLSGLESGDEVTLSGSPVFVFTSRNASSDVSIDVSGYALSGTSAGNYTLTQPVLVADITPKALSVEVIANNKTYDKTKTATVGSVSLVGIENGDVVDIENSPSAFDFVSDDVGTDIAISATGNYTITGTDAGNYSVTQPSGLTADITAKRLTITGLTGTDKIYDDATSGSVTGTASLSGLEAGDDVSLGGSPVYTFASANVGTGITVNTTGYTISGTDSGNYTLNQPNLSADITAKGLTITGLTGTDKVYDDAANGSATGTASLSGLEVGDDVSLGGSPVYTFASANVGTGITVNTTGYTISGTDSGNYTLTQPTLSANITAKGLTLTGLTGADKVYDNATSGSATGTATLSGLETGDDVSLGGSPVYIFASANVGIGIMVNTTGYTISGTDSGNYMLTQPTLSADITAKGLTITGLTGDNKVYDSITTGSATGTASLSGLEAGDDVSLGGSPVFTFASANVGTGITINTTGYTISGTDSGNYTLTQPTLSANITEPTVAFAITSSNQLESVSSANINVALSSVTAASVTVNYTVTGTSTGSGTDYLLADGVLTIDPNSSSNDIPITITDDTLDEFDETIIVTLSNPSNATLGTNTIHTYTITDNDDAPSVEFGAATGGQAESESSQDLPISISAISGKKITVDYAATGTATGSGTDYTFTDGTFTFDPGDQNLTLQLTGIIDDLLDEGSETIILTLSNPTNATLGTQETLTYTITDNDAPPTVSLSVGTNSIVEAAGTTSITATLSAVSGLDVTVNLGYSGTATNGTDYNITVSSSVTIPAGQTSTNAAVGLTAIQDTDGEGPETIIVDITSVTNGTEDGTQQQTVTLVDDDDITAPSGYSVTMNDALIGGAETATSTFIFTGAEVGATYNYTMSSDGGGSDVTGTGTISTATDEITIAELSGLGDGTLSLSVTLTDPSGNIGTVATSGASKDATAPNLPVVSSITADSGNNGADQITNDNTPDVNGTAEANATVEVFVDGVSVGTTSADTDGNWIMAYNGSSPVNDGGLAITANATDAAGNTSAESSALNVTIDTAAPSAPVIISISTDSGNSGADGITNDNTLNIIGTAEANATVEIIIDGISIGTTTADIGGDFSFDHTGTTLGDATYSLTAKATDAAGNESAESSVFNVTIDTSVPTVSTITRKEADQLNTATTTANFRVIFSESVSGVDATDFEIALAGTTGAVNAVTTVDDKTYDVNVNGISGEGTVGINVKDDDSILDFAGNALGGTGLENGDFTTGEVYVTNALPTDITLSGSISENNAIGEVARVLSSLDTNAGDSHTYALISGTGDTDNGSFSIVGNELKAGVIFDFETKDSYTVRVKTDDGFGGSFEKALTIDIDNVLETSVFIVQDETEFDISALGLRQERTITITNDGEITVNVVASAPTDFSISPSTFNLSINESIELTISFEPNQVKVYNEQITFSYEGINILHPVTGEGAVITSVDNGSIDAANISIYPNPADRYLTIDLSELSVDKLDIKIVNTAGVKLFGIDEYTNKELRLDVSSYESGIYILQFTNGTSIVRKKVMIKR